ncbi:hypothetical protein GCM10027613_49680 [Microlunatus endophyticus]
MSEADTQDAAQDVQPTYDAPEQIFIGGYTTEMGGGAAGLSRLSGADPSTEPATLGLHSPTFVIKHPSEPWLYAINETTPGSVSAVLSDDNGLHLINTVESGGDGGCHLCFDHTGNFVVVAHYTSGSIASFRIEDNGALSERIGLLQFSGSGPDPERQDAAHAHEVVSVGSSILVPDLGTDSVHIVRIDGDGNLTPATDSITLPPGSGPGTWCSPASIWWWPANCRPACGSVRWMRRSAPRASPCRPRRGRPTSGSTRRPSPSTASRSWLPTGAPTR